MQKKKPQPAGICHLGEHKAKPAVKGNYPLTVGIHDRSLVDERVVGDVRYYLAPAPLEVNMRLPDRVLNCVGFIAHDTPNAKYGATGFVVGYQDAALRYTHYYFVTAKHVAERVEPGSFVLALSGKNHRRTQIVRAVESLKWWYHPTDPNHVDVAVALFYPPADLLDVSTVLLSTFATDETIKDYCIGVGDEISVVGLFTRFSGTAVHSPIVRTGNIAMMPSEPIPTRDFGPMEAYLVEGRSIGGLSGSPVFARHTVWHQLPRQEQKLYGVGGLHLLGLMHGHWELPLDFQTVEKAEAVNMGISIVVPARKIIEVLNHPELDEMRKQTEKESMKLDAPVADSSMGDKSKVFTQEDFESALMKASRKLSDKK